MPDDENQSVEAQSPQDVAQPSDEGNVEVRQEEAPAVKPSRQDQDYNWAEARRKREELERQNQELAQRLRDLENKDEEVHLNEDDLPTYGNVKKVLKKSGKDLKEEIRREVKAEMAQTTLKLHYPDFDQIVTPENIELLKQHKPALARTLALNSDPYDQAVAAYDAIKMAGFGKEMPKSNDKEKAIKNAAKPVSVNAVTKNSALGNAHLFENGLTPELKKQLWSEMQQAMKGA